MVEVRMQLGAGGSAGAEQKGGDAPGQNGVQV